MTDSRPDDAHRRLLDQIAIRVVDLPSLFTIVPADRSRFDVRNIWSSPVRIVLWCTEPGHQHPVPETSFDTSLPKQWFVRALPHLRTVLQILRVAPIAGGALGVSAADIATQLQILEAICNSAEEALNETTSSSASTAMAVGSADSASPVESPSDRAVRSLLRKIGETTAFAPLYTTVTGDGHVVWLCPFHIKQRQVARRSSDSRPQLPMPHPTQTGGSHADAKPQKIGDVPASAASARVKPDVPTAKPLAPPSNDYEALKEAIAQDRQNNLFDMPNSATSRFLSTLPPGGARDLWVSRAQPLLAAARESLAWEHAIRLHSVASYVDYIKSYPKSERASVAAKALARFPIAIKEVGIEKILAVGILALERVRNSGNPMPLIISDSQCEIGSERRCAPIFTPTAADPLVEVVGRFHSAAILKGSSHVLLGGHGKLVVVDFSQQYKDARVGFFRSERVRVEPRQQTVPVPAHGNAEITAIAASSVHDLGITGDGSGNIAIWPDFSSRYLDLRRGKKPVGPSRTFVGHTGRVNCLALSRSHAASGGDDGIVAIWNYWMHTKVNRAFHGSAKVVSVALSGDTDPFVLSGGVDGILRLWNSEGQQVHAVDLQCEILSVAFSDYYSGERAALAIGTSGVITLWDWRRRGGTFSFKADDAVTSAVNSTAGRFVGVKGASGIGLYDVKELIETLGSTGLLEL